jgi:hypothetical protein
MLYRLAMMRIGLEKSEKPSLAAAVLLFIHLSQLNKLFQLRQARTRLMRRSTSDPPKE